MFFFFQQHFCLFNKFSSSNHNMFSSPRSVNRAPTHTACTDAYSVSSHTLNRMITFHHANTRSAQAQGCTRWGLTTVVIHVSCPFLCRTWHWPQAQVPSHLSPSFRRLLLTSNSFGARSQITLRKSTDRVTDQHKSHSLAGCEPKIYRVRRPSAQKNWARQESWTDPYQTQERIMGNNYQNPISENMGEFGKVGVEMSYVQSQIHSDYDSAESIADSYLEDGELRKISTSPSYRRRWDSESSRKSKLQGNLGSVTIQKRGASAQRADHSRRESLMWSSFQEPTACGKRDAMFSAKSKEQGESVREFNFNSLTHQIWEDLFLKTIKIIAQPGKIWTNEARTPSWISQLLYRWASATILC